MALALGLRSRSAASTVAKVEGLYGSFADAVPVAHNTLVLVAADTHTFFVFRCFGKSVRFVGEALCPFQL